ncbi:MAG: LacI family DNA-binding transcriptional regulator [Candidatus Promineifilaceae bacterium]|nr:LacI family DNA-binding transcriptional regulator [Candidatus Promineifilaceae bacterium]
MSRSKVTIRDVATYAGVSHQTVSRVINGSRAVRPATRARVEEAIAALDYRPDALAQSMARGRSGYLACLSPNLTDYTFSSIIDAAEMEARENGYYLMSASAPDAETFHHLIEDLVQSGRTEGIMVINPFADDRHNFLPKGHPVVFAGARPREEAADSVALDDVNVALNSTKHLLDLGHRYIGMITGPGGEDCTQDRTQGFLQALQQAGLDSTAPIVEGNWLPDSGYRAFKQFCALDKRPTAIFAQNDNMAVGVLRAARDFGLLVPDQLSVIGVDDIPMAAYFAPPLTTIRQDFSAIGRQAARLLVRAVKNAVVTKEHLLLPGEMIIRRSTAPAADARDLV